MAEAKNAFKMFKKACCETPVLAFANYKKPFLLETEAIKLGLGVVLSQKQIDGQYHPVAYASWSLTTHDHNYHSMKQEFLALKWVIDEQFQGYLLWKPFIARTDNNPLTYIMTTTNLDATWLSWVESLARLMFSIEYKKDLTMQLQISCAESHWSWMQKLWSPSWMGSSWHLQKELMLMTQWWPQVTKKYISQSRKMWFWLELHA